LAVYLIGSISKVKRPSVGRTAICRRKSKCFVPVTSI
jgi:hypothetical protein